MVETITDSDRYQAIKSLTILRENRLEIKKLENDDSIRKTVDTLENIDNSLCWCPYCFDKSADEMVLFFDGLSISDFAK